MNWSHLVETVMFQEEEKALSQGLPVQRPDVDVARWDIHCEYGGLRWELHRYFSCSMLQLAMFHDRFDGSRPILAIFRG